MPTDTALNAQISQTRDELAAVKVGDTGSFEAIAALYEDGAPIEAVVTSVEEADALAASRFGNRVARVRIDLSRLPAAWARRESVAIRASLQANGVTAPRAESGLAETPVRAAA